MRIKRAGFRHRFCAAACRGSCPCAVARCDYRLHTTARRGFRFRAAAGQRTGIVLATAVAICFLGSLLASAQSLKFNGMLSLQSGARFDSAFEPVFNLRFIPEFTFSLKSGKDITIDAEASANAFGTAVFCHDKAAGTSGDLKPYRAWVRLSTSRFEARAGLQKVNFGSATLFRPMMWFDSIDPRDPLQLTDGVYALLLRYYTKSNANFWAWTMLGNDTRRGWDLAPPDKKTPEFGGRIQIPFFKGEIAATYHRRKAAIDGLVPSMLLQPASPLPVPPVPEERFGIDGKWDIGIGVWVEGTLVHQKTALLPLPWQQAYNVGLDYTFKLGNGLYVLAEHFRLASAARAFGSGEGLSFSALLARYPLSILDEVMGIFYYDWKNRDLYRFFTWKRTYNMLSLNLMFFWNPEKLLVFQGREGSASFSGTGFQILLALHF